MMERRIEIQCVNKATLSDVTTPVSDDLMLVSMHSDFIRTITTEDDVDEHAPAVSHLRVQLTGDNNNSNNNGDMDVVCTYQAFGALRSGAVSSEQLSHASRPLLICAALAGMLAIWALYPLRQMLVVYFFDYHKPKKNFVTLLVPWCNVTSLALGMLSDCVPLLGYRRKSFIALGYILAGLAALGMALIYFVMDPASTTSMVLYLILLVILTTALQLSWVVLFASSIEYAQHEPLHERGRLQTLLFILYFTGMWVTQIGAASVLHPKEDGVTYTSSLSLGMVCVVFAILSVLPLPILQFYWHEERVHTRPCWLLTKRFRELWRLLAQKAVYQLLVALAVMVVFTAANNSNVNSVARFTSGFTGADVQWLYLSAYIPRAVSAWIWRTCLINTSWRAIASGGFIFIGAMKSMCTVMLINNVLRGRVLYIIMSSLTQIPQGWITLFQVIPTTEIAYVGREATMIGLVQTSITLVSIGTQALWAWVQRVVNLNVTQAEIQADTPRMRSRATLATMLTFGFNTLCITMVFFMPRQKLDAQQQRAFGGYHKLTRTAFVGALLALLAFDLHNNITKMVKL